MLVEESPLAIIADDLTGACDTACQFRLYGLRVVVTDAARLAWDSSVRILAVNSDSRKQNAATAYPAHSRNLPAAPAGTPCSLLQEN